MLNMGSGRLGGWGTGIALPATHPVSHTPGTPLPHPGTSTSARRQSRRAKVAVGLKSVDQLTLSVHFSGFLGMTEVYNLLKIGRINNHFFIPGTD